ncbi:hypothetical protein PATSB16_31650 [Pandoraea thiooxydans]|nr:hypothetical protein PATSB16_31650 [Pandoraea thiooxydans]
MTLCPRASIATPPQRSSNINDRSHFPDMGSPRSTKQIPGYLNAD